MLSLIVLVGLVPIISKAEANPHDWRAEGWMTDFSKRSIGWNEIASGGPPKDGIPSIDDPEFVSVGPANDLKPREPVIGLEIDGEAKAYPLRILIWHEIVTMWSAESR
jgi:hypothetical protein